MELTPEYINKHFPVVAIEKYPNNCIRVLRYGGATGYYKTQATEQFISKIERTRGRIMEFSDKSLKSLMWTMQTTEVDFASMFTLTYPAECWPMLESEIIKKNLNAVLQRLKKRYGDYFEYVWFLEFTKNGAPHFHVLTTVDAISPRDRWALADTWVNQIMSIFYSLVPEEFVQPDDYDFWAKIQTKVARVILHNKSWELIRDKNGAKKYVAKYALKRDQKRLPASWEYSGRFWGASGGVKADAIDVVPITDDELRLMIARAKGEEFVSRMPVIPKFLWQIKA